MQAFHSDRFEPELPAGHRFPMQKYRLLRERVAATLPEVVLREAPGAALADLLRVHTSSYVEAVRTGSLSPAAQREIGFPWSPMWVERALRSVGATVAAWEAACVDGVAVNLAGGTHHASADAGAAFACSTMWRWRCAAPSRVAKAGALRWLIWMSTRAMAPPPSSQAMPMW